MHTRYVYPGTFSPPTRAHLHVVERVASLLPHLTIVCSTNVKKPDDWFSEAESAALWRSYELPTNVSIATLTEMRDSVDMKNMVMVRGYRNKHDYDYEFDVLERNYSELGIDTMMLVKSPRHLEEISSSAVRSAAERLDLAYLAQCVSPGVVTALLEKVLGIRNIFLVVGKPASGKSSLLRHVSQSGENNVWINTDDWNEGFKSMIQASFPDMSPLDAVLAYDAQVSELLRVPWLFRLEEALKKVPNGANVFVEAAYGLAPTKRLYRYIGAKIVSVECDDVTTLARRNLDRNTPELAKLIDRIPSGDEVTKIAKANRLALRVVKTSGSFFESVAAFTF